jgi:hypothetical protein
MHNDIKPRFDRSLDPWSSERIIANGNQFLFACDLSDRVKIDQFEQRIARGLDPNHARVWFDCALEIFRVGQIDIGKIEVCGTPAHSIEKPEGAAVQVIARNNMRAALEQLQHRRHRRQTGREREPARSAFQIGDALFVCQPGGIDRPRVIVAFVFSGAFLHIRRRGVNWRYDGARRGIRLLPGVNGARREALFFFHLKLSPTVKCLDRAQNPRPCHSERSEESQIFVCANSAKTIARDVSLRST